jgi:hypothetical protein
MIENTIKLGFRPRDAIAAIGSKSLYERCVRAGWLTPVVRQHKLTLYRHEDVARCWARIVKGELPAAEPAIDKEAAQ